MRNYLIFECHVFPPSSSRAEQDGDEVGWYSCKTFKNSEFEFSFPVKQSVLRKIAASKDFQKEVGELIKLHIAKHE
jgi:hypothetical protein